MAAGPLVAGQRVTARLFVPAAGREVRVAHKNPKRARKQIRRADLIDQPAKLDPQKGPTSTQTGRRRREAPTRPRLGVEAAGRSVPPAVLFPSVLLFLPLARRRDSSLQVWAVNDCNV